MSTTSVLMSPEFQLWSCSAKFTFTSQGAVVSTPLIHGWFFLDRQQMLVFMFFWIYSLSWPQSFHWKCVPVAFTLTERAGFLGLLSPKMLWFLLVQMMVKMPCYIRGHNLEVDYLVYRGQWERDKLTKCPLGKHSNFLEHGCFVGRKEELIQQAETSHLIQ